MLVPREKRESRTLVYVCRTEGCGYVREADSPVTYRLEIVKSVV
jgi:DNA-directed RNA polymerase subunit M/transcription elongation factor TFIIS